MTGLSDRDRTQKLYHLLGEIGSSPEARAAIIDTLVKWERVHQTDGDDLRDRVTGPIVDALHEKVPAVERTLSSGVTISLPYSSKIAREYAMGMAPLSHVWEPQTTRLLLALARSATTALVGGAYAGDQAVLMADKMKSTPQGTVHCFELNPVQIEALRGNAKRNGLTNLIVNPLGLWSEAGFVELQGDDSHASPVAVKQRTAKSLAVTTVEKYADEKGIRTIDVIMLDVEGGEQHILEGARRFLSMDKSKAPDVVFEVHSSYVDWSQGLAKTAVVAHLIDLGYSVFAVRDFQGNMNLGDLPLEVVSTETAYLQGPPHGFNMYATKNPEKIGQLGIRVRHNVSPKLLRHRLSPLHQPGGDAT